MCASKFLCRELISTFPSKVKVKFYLRLHLAPRNKFLHACLMQHFFFIPDFLASRNFMIGTLRFSFRIVGYVVLLQRGEIDVFGGLWGGGAVRGSQDGRIERTICDAISFPRTEFVRRQSSDQQDE